MCTEAAPCTIVVRAYFTLEGLKSALRTSHLTILTPMFAMSESFFPDIDTNKTLSTNIARLCRFPSC